MKKGWTYNKLGEVAYVIHGKNQKDVLSEDGQYPIYGSGGNIMGYATDYLCEAGSTILGRKGSINNPQFIEERFWNVDTAFGIMPKDDNCSKYIYYFIKSIDWLKKNTGTTLPSLTQQVVKDVIIPTPKPSEQRRIVSRLDAAFAQIDALKANAEKQLSEARALFQKALEEAMKPKKGWEEKTLGEVCEIFGRIGFRGYTKTDFVNSSEKGAITLSPSNIVNGEMNYSKCSYITWAKYEESPEIKIFPGDILLVKTASVGKTAIVKELPHEATINPQFVVLKNIIINRYYLSYYLKSEKSQQYIWSIAKGAAAQTVSQKNLAEMKVPFAPLSEQHQIVSHLDSLSAKVRELEEVQRKTLAECDALKQAMLREVFE